MRSLSSIDRANIPRAPIGQANLHGASVHEASIHRANVHRAGRPRNDERNFGYSAAHETDPLPLLPSGPGGVRGESLHRARSSTHRRELGPRAQHSTACESEEARPGQGFGADGAEGTDDGAAAAYF